MLSSECGVTCTANHSQDHGVRVLTTWFQPRQCSNNSAPWSVRDIRPCFQGDADLQPSNMVGVQIKGLLREQHRVHNLDTFSYTAAEAATACNHAMRPTRPSNANSLSGRPPWDKYLACLEKAPVLIRCHAAPWVASLISIWLALPRQGFRAHAPVAL